MLNRLVCEVFFLLELACWGAASVRRASCNRGVRGKQQTTRCHGSARRRDATAPWPEAAWKRLLGDATTRGGAQREQEKAMRGIQIAGRTTPMKSDVNALVNRADARRPTEIWAGQPAPSVRLKLLTRGFRLQPQQQAQGDSYFHGQITATYFGLDKPIDSKLHLNI